MTSLSAPLLDDGADHDAPLGATRARVLALLERHGWNATAFQTLAPGYAYFFAGPDACVAYVDTGRAWVAAGAPIAAASEIARAAGAFERAARAAGRRACFFATEERLRSAAAGSLDSLRIGEQPSWDPRGWPRTLAGSRSLREQLRRARAKGVRVRRLTAGELQDATTRAAVERLAARWLSTREMAPMDFLVQLTPFLLPSHRQCFVAERDGQLVGFAGVIPVPARGGWFIENLLRDPAAPSGTGELLVDAVMRWAAGAGCGWLTLGLAPLAGDLAGPLRVARRHTGFLYDFEGLRSYKARLRPALWSPIFLSYPASQGPLWSLLDALEAFSGGGLVRFGLRTLLRGPRAALAALGAVHAATALGLLALALRAPGLATAHHGLAAVAPGLLAAGLVRLGRRPSGALFARLSLGARLGALGAAASLALPALVAARAPVAGAALHVASAALLVLTAAVLAGAHARYRQAG